MIKFPRSTGHDRLDAIRAKMRPAASLRYGESPWDTLDKEDLLFLVQSYHAVVESAASALELNTLVSIRSGRCEEVLASCRAAKDYVFSDYLGPLTEKCDSGAAEVLDNLLGDNEHDVFRAATMRPVSDLLAFDAPHSIWWACEACDIVMGIQPGKEPSSPRARSCEGGSKCSFRRADWDDWRKHGRPESKTE